jgi:Phospholipase_D-nuclease N-terminal
VQAIRNPRQDAERAVAGLHWNDLSKRNQRLLIAAAVIETSLKAAALVDITRRPASQIRGPKWAWIPAVSIINSAGLAPIAYFAWGRRPVQR